jgi:hypothetical protein
MLGKGLGGKVPGVANLSSKAKEVSPGGLSQWWQARGGLTHDGGSPGGANPGEGLYILKAWEAMHVRRSLKERPLEQKPREQKCWGKARILRLRRGCVNPGLDKSCGKNPGAFQGGSLTPDGGSPGVSLSKGKSMDFENQDRQGTGMEASGRSPWMKQRYTLGSRKQACSGKA